VNIFEALSILCFTCTNTKHFSGVTKVVNGPVNARGQPVKLHLGILF